MISSCRSDRTRAISAPCAASSSRSRAIARRLGAIARRLGAIARRLGAIACMHAAHFGAARCSAAATCQAGGFVCGDFWACQATQRRTGVKERRERRRRRGGGELRGGGGGGGGGLPRGNAPELRLPRVRSRPNVSDASTTQAREASEFPACLECSGAHTEEKEAAEVGCCFRGGRASGAGSHRAMPGWTQV